MIDLVIDQRRRDIGGGFEVGRVLPFAQRRMVGPFVFFDHMGPMTIAAGAPRSLDVRPHPHIGLSTVTYLYDGEIMHRDSLGTEQRIRPGDVNWMTAGRGIAHSERSPESERATGGNLFGIQAWVALPAMAEETAPTFAHHGKEALPVIAGEGKEVRLITGSLYGERSPVPTFTEMFYADARLDAGAKLPLPAEHEERAVYVTDGEVEVAGDRFAAGQLLVFRPGDRITLAATRPSRLLLLGGEPMDGPRHIWWNFVSSRQDRIEQAKADWRAGRFAAVPGETEFIPLPER